MVRVPPDRAHGNGARDGRTGWRYTLAVLKHADFHFQKADPQPGQIPADASINAAGAFNSRRWHVGVSFFRLIPGECHGEVDLSAAFGDNGTALGA
jgi:hypothetical protein